MGALALLLAAAAPLLAAQASPPPSVPAAGSAQIVMASGVQDKQPQGAGFQFGSQQSVYCWTRVRGEAGRTIRHVWKRGGVVVRSVSLKIGADDYRTWSRKDSLWPGHWTVAVEDEDGRLLGPETSFIVGDSFEAGPGYSVQIRDVSPTRLEALLIAADTASVTGYAGEDGKIEDLLPGERPLLTLRPPKIPDSQDTFDLPFQARVVDAHKQLRTLSLALHGVPNPSRLEDWAGAIRRTLSGADANASR